MQPPNIDRQQRQCQDGASRGQLGELMIESGRVSLVRTLEQSSKPGPDIDRIQSREGDKNGQSLPKRQRQMLGRLVKGQNQQRDNEIYEVGEHFI